MGNQDHYLILLDAGDGVYYLGIHGEHTLNSWEAKIFPDALEAREYIDRRGMDHIASMRRIRVSAAS